MGLFEVTEKKGEVSWRSEREATERERTITILLPGASLRKKSNDQLTIPQALSPVVAEPSKKGRTLASEATEG